MSSEPVKINHGRNVQRMRESLGVGQAELAKKLDIPLSEMFQFEQKEVIEEPFLEKIAAILHIPVELITNLKEDASMTFVSNIFREMSMGIMGVYNTNNMENCTFNPIDKLVSVYNEKGELYERLLKSEQEKIAILQKKLTHGNT